MKKHMSRSTLVMVLLDIVLGVVLSLYIANTGTVLLCSLVIGACIWIFDGVAVLLIKTLIDAFTG